MCVFTELQNAQAVVLPYDGLNPLLPQCCYVTANVGFRITAWARLLHSLFTLSLTSAASMACDA